MRKILYTVAVISLGFFLVSCSKSKKVTIESKDKVNNTYSYVLNAKGEYTDEESLSLAYNSVYELYMQLDEVIEPGLHYLNITFKINGKEIYNLSYTINESLNSPGLKLIKNIKL